MPLVFFITLLVLFLHHWSLMSIASPNMHSTQKFITDTDKSLLVQVLVLMFLVIFLFSGSIRIGTKIRMTKTLTVDDILTIAATVSRDLISRFTKRKL
jgi:amino acid transporter